MGILRIIYYIELFHETHPNIDVYTELEKAVNNNKNIRAYVDCVQKTEEYRRKIKNERTKYSSIIEEIETVNCFVLMKRELTKHDIIQIADKFLSEKDIHKKAKFLSVFSWVKYPYNYKPLLNIAKLSSNKYRIKEYAIEALKYIHSNEIREFALNKVNKTTHPAIYTNLLLSNYKEGDELPLTDIVNKFKNEHEIESLACSYVDIYTKNKTKSCQLPLEALYNKMNCGIHRNAIIEILIENNVLSDKLKAEIKFDSYEDTRILASNIK